MLLFLSLAGESFNKVRVGEGIIRKILPVYQLSLFQPFSSPSTQFITHVVEIAKKSAIYRLIIKRLTGRYIAIYGRLKEFLLSETCRIPSKTAPI